ncbi:hypothetical protein [Cysteiniphilum litorale]|uniref:hypothetical protein n=1 Tax=Cysteiniphilum litorale TaxID=2056700 RepID=UPI003F881792
MNQKTSQLQQVESDITTKTGTSNQLDNDIASKRSDLQTVEFEISSKRTTSSQLDSDITTKNNQLTQLGNDVSAKENELNQKTAQLQTQANTYSNADTSLSLNQSDINRYEYIHGTRQLSNRANIPSYEYEHVIYKNMSKQEIMDKLSESFDHVNVDNKGTAKLSHGNLEEEGESYFETFKKEIVSFYKQSIKNDNSPSKLNSNVFLSENKNQQLYNIDYMSLKSSIQSNTDFNLDYNQSPQKGNSTALLQQLNIHVSCQTNCDVSVDNLEKTRQELQRVYADFIKLESENKKLKDDLQNMKTHNTNLEMQLEYQSGEKITDDTCTPLKVENTVDVSNIKELNTVLLDKIDELVAKNNKLQLEVATLQTKMKKLKSEIEQIEKFSKDQIEAHVYSIQELEAQVDDLKDKLDSCNCQNCNNFNIDSTIKKRGSRISFMYSQLKQSLVNYDEVEDMDSDNSSDSHEIELKLD